MLGLSYPTADTRFESSPQNCTPTKNVFEIGVVDEIAISFFSFTCQTVSKVSSDTDANWSVSYVRKPQHTRSLNGCNAIALIPCECAHISTNLQF
jgi:hypothetical protein